MFVKLVVNFLSCVRTQVLIFLSIHFKANQYTEQLLAKKTFSATKFPHEKEIIES